MSKSFTAKYFLSSLIDLSSAEKMQYLLSMNKYAIGFVLTLSTSFSALFAQEVRFQSPNGQIETCQILSHWSEAQYSNKDIETEKSLCQLNFYSPEVFSCGKNWSTSPSTLIFKKNNQFISADPACENKKSMDISDKVGKFKVSMNESGTSGTFSSSSLLYYHLARYLTTSIIVPVAVYREMDVKSHFELVTSKVKNFENEMVQTAWDYLYRAENGNPNTIQPVRELFTADFTKIHGALIDTIGNEKYGEHIRGQKQPEWGLQQHIEMKKTPVFRALFSTKDFYNAQAEAAQFGLAQFKNDFNKIAPTSHQMMSWMQDMSDMAVLDYLMQQQDRPGNIHFQWRIYYTSAGKLKSDRIKVVSNGVESGLEKKFKLPKDIDRVTALALELPKYKKVCNQPDPCFIIQKTVLEDNNAGGRVYYKDFFRQSGILESLRHMNRSTYVQLLKLEQSLSSKDQTYLYLENEFKLDSTQLNLFQKNLHQAVQVLQKSYQSGLLQLDLDFSTYFANGKVFSSKK